MNTIDFHTHIFSEKIAEKALFVLSKNSGGAQPFYNGTKSGLLNSMAKNGVAKSVVMNIATNEKQQKIINDFAAEITDEKLIGFGSVFPLCDTALDEIDRLCDLGIKGIKLHPDYQKFYVDDKRVFPLYEKIAEKKLMLCFHAGVDIGLYPPIYCTPERLKAALHYLKGATVIAAHLGGYLMYERVKDRLCGEDLYFDTSYSYARIPPKMAEDIIKTHGTDRILFGSDGPWSDSGDEIRYIDNLDLSDSDKEKIYYKNAEDLLK